MRNPATTCASLVMVLILAALVKSFFPEFFQASKMWLAAGSLLIAIDGLKADLGAPQVVR